MTDKKELQLDIHVTKECDKCGKTFLSTALTNNKTCNKCRR